MREFTVTVKSKDEDLAKLTATVEAKSAFDAVKFAVTSWEVDSPWVWDYAWAVAKYNSATGTLVLRPGR